MNEEAVKRLRMLARNHQWDEVDVFARECLAIKKFFIPHLFLIQSLMVRQRWDDADREFEDLASYKFNLVDRLDMFPRVAERYKTRLGNSFVMSTMGEGISFEQVTFSPEVHVARWKVAPKISAKSDFYSQASLVLNAFYAEGSGVVERLPVTTCVTFGSCFAANLAKKFNEKGLKTKCLLIEESVNSTMANKLLLEVASGILSTDAHKNMLDIYGSEFFEEIRAALALCSHVVMTVGVAPSFFDVQTGDFIFAARYGDLLRDGKIRMKTTTVEANKHCLKAIASMLKILAPNAALFFTLSPVPLIATSEMSSVLVADCVSKSTLRAAVHETLCETKGISYFPAFELVRWLSGHSSLNVFGEDDGNSRHVSDWLVGFIVEEFRQRFVSE